MIRGMIKPILISLSYQILQFIFVKAYSVWVGRTCAGILNFNICIVVGHSMIKTGRVIVTLTGICHMYLPAPAIFIYQHLPHLYTSTCHIYLPPPATFIYHNLPHLSTTTCISNVKCRSLFEFGDLKENVFYFFFIFYIS